LKREIRITDDGSTTLYVHDMNENYHSIHGAIQESMHVFIQSGLLQLTDKQDISIFEMGFGTGLNCFLTLLHAGKTNVQYTALEKYPLEDEIIKKLNYYEILRNIGSNEHLFHSVHSAPWNNIAIQINDKFFLQKCKEDLLDFTTDKTFDLIYFDAFAPQFQPELWTEDIFQKMFEFLGQNGILVTYCAKGQVRRNMIKSGFCVEKISGPPGKREMLRAYRKK
jgi:tRNA U34 5-methylaminomethyl-2-thiouridine-forming methyltransferase MnmC